MQTESGGTILRFGMYVHLIAWVYFRWQGLILMAVQGRYGFRMHPLQNTTLLPVIVKCSFAEVSRLIWLHKR